MVVLTRGFNRVPLSKRNLDEGGMTGFGVRMSPRSLPKIRKEVAAYEYYPSWQIRGRHSRTTCQFAVLDVLLYGSSLTVALDADALVNHLSRMYNRVQDGVDIFTRKSTSSWTIRSR